MCEIKYMLKPDWVSWDAVQKCQRKAHEETNNNKGFHMMVQDLSGEDLRRELEDNGQCFIALVGDEVVGVSGVKFFKGTRWWSFGKKVALNCMDGILPDYQGTDVYFGLNELRMNYIVESGADMIQSTTAFQNFTIRKIAKLKKFKEVRFSPTCAGADYYTVVMAKWLNGCPYSDCFIRFMFRVSEIVVKIIWKPGRKCRFWPW